MPKANPIQSSFNAGELSPTLEGRVDLSKYGSGCKTLENFIPMVQGPARRRSGTYFAAEVKNSANRSWLIRFEFSETQAFVLEFGDQYIRFYTNYGQLLAGTVTAWVTSTAYKVGDLRSNGGVKYYCKVDHTSGTFSTDLASGYWHALTGDIYEIPTPYTLSDLTAANDTLRLRMVQSADVIYIVHPNHAPKKLSRFSATKWTLTDVEFFGGPFEDVNPDETVTVYSSAETGSVTLTASGSIFTADDVGSLFLLEQKTIDGIAQWEVGKTVTAGVRRRSDGKTYEALTSGDTGTVKPIHSRGAVYDGDPGVQWAFRDPGYGWVKITGYTSATTVSATVISRIPAGATGSGNATTRWAFSRWSKTNGWPSQVTFFRERLVFATGQKIDMSVAGDYEDFSDRDDGGQVVADQAIAVEISSDQINKIEWLAPSDGLLIGTAGAEFVLGEVTTDQPLGPDNVKITQQSAYGSRSVIPVLVGDSVLFVQRSGQKVRELVYDFANNGFKSSDVTVLSEHITYPSIISMAYQQEPHSVIWCVRGDGKLLGFTFNREQDVLGWHKHQLGGDGIVESVVTIPSPVGDQDDLWMIVRRTINGQTKRYVEYLWVDYTENEDPVDAFFVDSGLTYDGTNTGSKTVTITGSTYAPGDPLTIFFSASTLVYPGSNNVDDVVVLTDANGVEYRIRITEVLAVNEAKGVVNKTLPVALRNTATTKWALAIKDVSGLSHLEGKTVSVLTDGASHPDVVVQSGAVSLQLAATVIHIGLGCPAMLRTMRPEAGAGAGTAQGKTKRITDVTIRFLATLGAKAGPDENTLDEIQFRRGSDAMDKPPPIFTGDKELEWPNGYDTDGYVVIKQEQPLPMTVVAIMPELHTND